MNNAKTVEDWKNAAALFAEIPHYKNSSELNQSCSLSAVALQNENAYTEALNAMNNAKTEQAYRDAASMFAAVGNYKDALQLQTACTEKADSIYAKEHSVVRKAAKTAVKIPVVIFNTIITIATAGLALFLELMSVVDNVPYNLYNQDGTVILKTVTSSMYTNAAIMLGIAALISLPGLWKKIFKNKYAKWMTVLKWILVIVLCFAAFWIWKDLILHGSEYYVIVD